MSSSENPKRLPCRISFSRARQRRVNEPLLALADREQQLLRLVEAQRSRRHVERGAHLADGPESVSALPGSSTSVVVAAKMTAPRARDKAKSLRSRQPDATSRGRPRGLLARPFRAARNAEAAALRRAQALDRLPEGLAAPPSVDRSALSSSTPPCPRLVPRRPAGFRLCPVVSGAGVWPSPAIRPDEEPHGAPAPPRRPARPGSSSRPCRIAGRSGWTSSRSATAGR